MLVKNWMSKNVITVDVKDSMQDAMNIMKDRKIRILPVMKKGELVGVVTDRDLKRASASDATTLDVHELLYLISKIKIGDIMTRNPITVPLDYTIEETAEVLMTNKISGAPVVAPDGRVVGIITQDDLFKALMSLTGLARRGIQLAFQVEDRPGSIKEITDIVRSYGGRLVSILSSYENAPVGRRNVYIRAYDLQRQTISQLLEEIRAKAVLLYLVDHRDNKRELYS